MTLARDECPVLRRDDFIAIRRLAHARFGLWLRDGKEELVRTRLGKELRRLSIASFDEYIRQLVRDSSGELLEHFTNLLTTNHTTFFREPEHFRYLESDVLPQLGGRLLLEIWCAACATGEEAYSLAISAIGFRQSHGGTVSVLATDISTKALSIASRGVYEEARFSGVSPNKLRDYLLRSSREHVRQYRIRPEIRACVHFEKLNLVEAWDCSRRLPVIFCRNVMIYFDRGTQARLISRLAGQLEPGGYLFVGHSESLNGFDHGLIYVKPAVYRKPGKLAAVAESRL